MIPPQLFSGLSLTSESAPKPSQHIPKKVSDTQIKLIQLCV